MNLLKRIALNWLVIAVVLAITAQLFPDVEISGGVWGLALASAIFGLVNAVLGPLLQLVSLPLTAITFGLFALVVNGALLGISAGFSDWLQVGGPFGTVLAATFISILSALGNWLVLHGRHHASRE